MHQRLAKLYGLVGLSLAAVGQPSGPTRVPIHARPARADSCVPDTTGRTEMRRFTLGLVAHPLDSAKTSRAADLFAAQALREYFKAPAGLQLPLWARVVVEETQGDTSLPAWARNTLKADAVRVQASAPGFGLISDVVFTLDRQGRLLDSTIFVQTASPELNASLSAAIRSADSALDFVGLSVTEREPRGSVLLRLAVMDNRVAGVELLRLAVPTILAETAVQQVKVVAPRFPSVAARAGIPGSVDLQYVVTAEGKVDPASFRVIQGQYKEFVNAAAEAISQSTFQPARLRGCAVPSLVQQRVVFRVGP